MGAPTSCKEDRLVWHLFLQMIWIIWMNNLRKAQCNATCFDPQKSSSSSASTETITPTLVLLVPCPVIFWPGNAQKFFAEFASRGKRFSFWWAAIARMAKSNSRREKMDEEAVGRTLPLHRTLSYSCVICYKTETGYVNCLKFQFWGSNHGFQSKFKRKKRVYALFCWGVPSPLTDRCSPSVFLPWQPGWQVLGAVHVVDAPSVKVQTTSQLLCCFPICLQLCCNAFNNLWIVRSPPEKLLTRSAYLCSVQIFNPLSSSAVLAAPPVPSLTSPVYKLSVSW